MNSTPAPLATTDPSRSALNVALWAVQLLLAALFGMAGIIKSFTPLAQLSNSLAWTAAVPGPLVRFIGAAELAGAIGLLLPSIVRIRPEVTPVAGIGLATVMLLASGFHIMRAEHGLLGMPLGLGVLAAFVAWGRLRVLPIASRGRG